MQGQFEMIPDHDFWRAANLLIREHKVEAEVVAARRADEMLERGDYDGRVVWVRIRRANRPIASSARKQTELTWASRRPHVIRKDFQITRYADDV